MNTISTGKEIGLRCRRFRNALGLSQDALGEKVGILGATISKYEREGIYDIEKIQELSQALGHDLLTDEVDQEGTIGEVGKEILYTLICKEGYIEFSKLVKNQMYGMSVERVSKEIFKLEKIGMCVREQYKDWLCEDKDRVFITAKGIISFKNSELNSVIASDIYDLLSDVLSYESVIGEFDSFQALIDNSPAEKIIRLLANKIKDIQMQWLTLDSEPSTAIIRRINYITWLCSKFLSDIDKDVIDSCDAQFINGKGVYFDIIYRMALNYSNDFILNEILFPCYTTEEDDECDYYMRVIKSKMLGKEEYLIEEAKSSFREVFHITEDNNLEVVMDDFKALLGDQNASEIDSDTNDVDDEEGATYRVEMEIPEDSPLMDAVLWSMYCNRYCHEKYGMDLKELSKLKDNEESLKKLDEETVDLLLKMAKTIEWINRRIEVHHQINIQEKYENMKASKGSPYPTDWFTEEEIRDFINENFGPAVSEEDKEIDDMLRQVNKLIPESLDYFDFPKSWEENGLADLVRSNFGIVADESDDE